MVAVSSPSRNGNNTMDWDTDPNGKEPVFCQKNLFNPLYATSVQMAGILAISHIFHLALKPLGLGGPIAQILAGVVLGPSGLCHIERLRDIFFNRATYGFAEVILLFFRVLFMFCIGLEVDKLFLMRNLRPAATLACGGVVVCTIFGVAAAFILSILFKSHVNFDNAIIPIFLMGSTGSPLVISLASELKVANTEFGRLIISTALITEMSCVFLFTFYTASNRDGFVYKGIICCVLTTAVIVVNKYLATQFNRRNQNQKYLIHAEFTIFLCILLGTGLVVELLSFNCMIPIFLLGALFPRAGKSARTMSNIFTFLIHDLIFPVYFGYIGFQLDVEKVVTSVRNTIAVVMMILFSTAGKLLGTLAACKYLRLPLHKGVILAFFLAVKGHAGLTVINYESYRFGKWPQDVNYSFLAAGIVESLISSVIVALERRKEQSFVNRHNTLEHLDQEQDELRILGCVYNPRQVHATMGLFSALSGQRAPITPFLMHLVELPKNVNKSNLLFHETDEEVEFSKDIEDYSTDDALHINNDVDAFTSLTKILIRQSKTVSSFESMYEEVCTSAEDIGVSIVLLPFHKHWRIDKQMENDREEIRTTNQKVIRHVQCSVGIIIDREHVGVSQVPGPDKERRVATLFFGGPDDREAIDFSTRIATHPHISLTVFSFLPIPSTSSQPQHNMLIDNVSENEEEILMAISSVNENQFDKACLEDFNERYVRTGKATYFQKHVANGAQIAELLGELGNAYSLLIVGKGGAEHSSVTVGMRDWEECPELGMTGDLLASGEVDVSGSVLVIQKYRDA